MDDKNWNSKYDKKDYDKKIFSFRPQEVSKLTPWDMQIQLGAIAEKVLAGILRLECLKRVGLKNSPDIGVEYDFTTEQFVAYVPKTWCSACKNKRAEFSYKETVYCKDCIEVLKQQMAAQQPKEEIKTENPKEEKKTVKKRKK